MNTIANAKTALTVINVAIKVGVIASAPKAATTSGNPI